MLRKLIENFFSEEGHIRDIDVYGAMIEEVQNTSKKNKETVSNSVSVTTNTIFKTKVDPDEYLKKQNSVTTSFHNKL